MPAEERQKHLSTLRETPGRLKALLAGVPKKLALWEPAPGKWSILEIVCHMRDMERDAYLDRYRRILDEDGPTLPDIDGDQYSLERDYRAQRLAEVVRDWKRLRRESLKLLRSVGRDQWERRGTHETAGPITMEQLLVRQAVGNDEAHLAQIEAIQKRHEILGRLAAAPARLAQATRGLDSEAVRRSPTPGKWSAIEIACHLRDTERVYAERITKMAHRERPELWNMDNPRVAEALRYRDADPVAVTREFKRRREATLKLLEALPPPTWQRVGLHPKRGEITIEGLATVLAAHDDNHLAQIQALR
jgi:DinB superfamily